MKQILLIDPYEFLLEQYRGNLKYSIYSNRTLTYWEGESRKEVEISYPSTICNDINVNEIKSKIDWTMPLWFRWIGDADSYEDYQRICLLFVVSIVQELRRLDVTHAIFFTGVAHHVEYSLIEAACQIAGVQQIYLYPVPFCTTSSRLIPVMQYSSIRDRRIIGMNVSNKSIRGEIIEYKQNHLAAKPPKLNERIDREATSFLYAIARVALFGFKQLIKSVIKKNLKQSVHPIAQRRGHGFFSSLRMIRRQKSALDYYLLKMQSHVYVDKMLETEDGLPILYAHYQPEASTFPEGGDYASHLDVVIAIRKLGYAGKILYKEHPGSWIYFSKIVGFSNVGLCRSIEYYKQLEALGCVFVEPSYKLQGIRLQKLFPVTITGSIGIERSIVGSATCCAGIPWFKGAPGIYDIAESFGASGVFYDKQRWQLNPIAGVEWFDNVLSMKTINNYPGIGTGLTSTAPSDKADFLNEFEELMTQLFHSIPD